MSDTSVSTKSKATPKGSLDITPADQLLMVQAMLNRIANIPGLQVRRTNIYHEGQQLACAIFVGCAWDDAGNLVVIANTVPSANTEWGSAT